MHTDWKSDSQPAAFTLCKDTSFRKGLIEWNFILLTLYWALKGQPVENCFLFLPHTNRHICKHMWNTRTFFKVIDMFINLIMVMVLGWMPISKLTERHIYTYISQTCSFFINQLYFNKSQNKRWKKKKHFLFAAVLLNPWIQTSLATSWVIERCIPWAAAAKLGHHMGP